MKQLTQLLVLLCLATGAFGQLIQVQNQGTVIANWKKFGVINCSTNLVCTATGSTVNVVASVTASSAFSGITAATNANTGSFVISGSTWDFSGALALKWPVAAAFAPTADGSVGTNSTNHLPVFGSNGATLTYPVTFTAAAHNFVTGFTNTTGVFATAQPACADISNAVASCSTDATNANNIASGTLAAARLPNPSATTLGGVESLAIVSHKWINTISTSGVPAATQPACADVSDAAGGCTMSTAAAGDLSGTLPTATVVKINGNSVPSGAVADQALIGTAANTLGLTTLPNSTGGAAALTYVTSTHSYGTLSSILTGTLTSTRMPFSNGANSLTDSANLLYAAGSGFTQIQGANNTDAHYIKRNTDTAPTGNFLHFQDAAGVTDLFKVDVLGNITATSYSASNPAGNAGQLSLAQGTAPSAVANAVNFIAPTSVTTYTLTFPVAIGAGLFRTSSGGAVAFSELSGDATTSASNAVTVVKVNGVSYAAAPSTDTLPTVTAANTTVYEPVATCNADAAHANQYNPTTHRFECNGITATAAPAGSDTQVQYNNSAAAGASAALTFNKTDTLTIGVGGTTLGKLALAGNTSGTTTVNAAAAASGTLTLPAATDTLTGKATTDIFTNKTFDTAGTGNVLKINGTTVSAKTGTGSVVLATSPALTTPDLGTPSALNLTNATSLPCAATPALTGNVTTSAGSCATTVAAVPGAAIPVVNTVVDTSSPVTISTTLSAEFHYNENATAATAMTYNLPTAAAGKQFCISNAFNGTAPNTGVLTVATSAAGQFITFTDGTLSATGGNITSGGAAADAACVVGIDSTHWMLYVQRGTWTKH